MKKMIPVILLIVMTLVLVSGCSSSPAEDKAAEATLVKDGSGIEGILADDEFYSKADLSYLKEKKIGITVQSLENEYWAGIMTALKEILDESGAESDIVSCDDSSEAQIEQIKGFISAGCDLIMVHPSDAAAIESVCAEARSAGIKVVCWDDPMENTDVNWLLDNEALGYAIGELAAELINEHYTEQDCAEVIVVGHPKTAALLERENGILAALEEKASGLYKVVATVDGLTASDAKAAVENVLKSYPDAKVVVGVGAGAMIGADEALNIACGGVIPENMGVFSPDVTRLQLEHLQSTEFPAKGSIGFEGSDVDTASCCADIFALTFADKAGAHNVFRSVSRITEESAADFMSEMK